VRLCPSGLPHSVVVEVEFGMVALIEVDLDPGVEPGVAAELEVDLALESGVEERFEVDLGTVGVGFEFGIGSALGSAIAAEPESSCWIEISPQLGSCWAAIGLSHCSSALLLSQLLASADSADVPFGTIGFAPIYPVAADESRRAMGIIRISSHNMGIQNNIQEVACSDLLSCGIQPCSQVLLVDLVLLDLFH